MSKQQRFWSMIINTSYVPECSYVNNDGNLIAVHQGVYLDHNKRVINFQDKWLVIGVKSTGMFDILK